MPDLLNTSLTGMLAFQRALEVTNHNIANANTPGYSRQVSEFTTRIGSGVGNLQIGGGTQVSTIKRIYDSMLGEQLRTSTTSQQRFSTLNSLSGRIDSLLADADTGLSADLQSFFNALQDVTSDPASIAARQAFVGEAGGVVNRFQALDQQLGALQGEVNERLNLSVADINRLATSIATVNDRIAAASNAGQAPNDLLDERDRLVLALSEQVSITTTLQDDGAMNVFIGSGQSLVVGTTAQTLSVRGSEFDPTRLSVVYDGAAGATPLDTALTGGAIGGLLEFRTSMLDSALQSLGQTATAFAQSFNEQHNAGLDLRNNLGQDFFAVDPPKVVPSANNTGTGTAAATVSDLAALTGVNYVLSYDGAAYSLTRQDTGAAIPVSGTGTAIDPFVGGGISLVVGGGPASGDRMLIRTGQDAAGSLSSLITDPQAIAIAAPTRSSAVIGNTGDATISPATVLDPSDPLLFNLSTINFLSPSTYSINGAGVFNYIDGDPITINGSAVTITGTPVVGDQFTIEANVGASGDNSNGLLMSELQSRGILDGGSIGISENYSRLVSNVGVTSSQIQNNLAAQNVVVANAENAVLSNSGVNLDEEAANLIRYQQAYQAVAQVVGVANTLFDSLLNATSR